jgi:hypothetical protein
LQTRIEIDSPKRQSRARKQFFFEKKNQKTFAYSRHRLIGPFDPAALRKEQKFFVSFFQKRNTSFSSLACQSLCGLLSVGVVLPRLGAAWPGVRMRAPRGGP